MLKFLAMELSIVLDIFISCILCLDTKPGVMFHELTKFDFGAQRREL
jgi:hypothetical protein